MTHDPEDYVAVSAPKECVPMSGFVDDSLWPPDYGVVPDGTNREEWERDVKRILVDDYSLPADSFFLVSGGDQCPYRRAYDKKISAGAAAYFIYHIFD